MKHQKQSPAAWRRRAFEMCLFLRIRDLRRADGSLGSENGCNCQKLQPFVLSQEPIYSLVLIVTLLSVPMNLRDAP